MSSMSHVKSSSIQSVGTPQDLFDFLDKKFNFALDLAAEPGLAKCDQWIGWQNERHLEDREALIEQHNEHFGVGKKKSELHITFELYLEIANQNTLKLSHKDKRIAHCIENDLWMWLNSPFYNVGKWMEWCRSIAAKGGKIVALTPASIGSTWYRDFVERWAYSNILEGRLKFPGYKGSAGGYHMINIFAMDRYMFPLTNPRISVLPWKEGEDTVEVMCKRDYESRLWMKQNYEPPHR